MVYQTDMQTSVAFGWLSERSGKKYKFIPRELPRNQPILRVDIILQHDWMANPTMPSPYYGFLCRENEEAMF